MNTDLKNKKKNQLKATLKTKKALGFLLILALTLLTAYSFYGLIAKDNVPTFIALLAVACTCWSFVPLQFDAVRKTQAQIENL